MLVLLLSRTREARINTKREVEKKETKYSPVEKKKIKRKDVK
jgi:hypothetical protein